MSVGGGDKKTVQHNATGTGPPLEGAWAGLLLEAGAWAGPQLEAGSGTAPSLEGTTGSGPPLVTETGVVRRWSPGLGPVRC